MECDTEMVQGILQWLKVKLPDFKNKVEALAEDVSQKFIQLYFTK